MVHDEKGAALLILGKLKPKGVKHAEEHAEEHPDDAIHACAEDLLAAIEAKDVSGVAGALKAFFHVSEAAPHEEGPHVSEREEHGYE